MVVVPRLVRPRLLLLIVRRLLLLMLLLVLCHVGRHHVRRGLVVGVLLHRLGQFAGLRAGATRSDRRILALPFTVRLALAHDARRDGCLLFVPVLRSILLRNAALHTATGTGAGTRLRGTVIGLGRRVRWSLLRLLLLLLLVHVCITGIHL